jgi:gluconate 2-dehydrogenase gamma chain
VGKAEWAIVPGGTRNVDGALFFDAHQWAAIEAATARIIPTDHHPGAREAEVVRFIDRYVAGTDFVYASPRGDGFLRMEGKELEVWGDRAARRQRVYTEGILQLDGLSRKAFGRQFVDLTDDEQDAVLEELSGAPKPPPFSLDTVAVAASGLPTANVPVSDDAIDFFAMLVLHTRQGFYADPVYGGNKDRIGWRVIGFDGPRSLADTTDGTYTTIQYMIPDAEWPYDQHPASRDRHRSMRG